MACTLIRRIHTHIAGWVPGICVGARSLCRIDDSNRLGGRCMDVVGFPIWIVLTVGQNHMMPFSEKVDGVSLRGHFAEFLNQCSPERLRLLVSPTCVSFSTVTHAS